MTQDELIELLNAHEWRNIEFKEAQRDVPRNAYETVSAFANTEGGHLVFGVRKNGQDFEIVGVLDVDKVQSDFLTTLRQRDKLSVIVNVREELHKYVQARLTAGGVTSKKGTLGEKSARVAPAAAEGVEVNAQAVA
jgi:predicted HTH transcriptional regulator